MTTTTTRNPATEGGQPNVIDAATFVREHYEVKIEDYECMVIHLDRVVREIHYGLGSMPTVTYTDDTVNPIFKNAKELRVFWLPAQAQAAEVKAETIKVYQWSTVAEDVSKGRCIVKYDGRNVLSVVDSFNSQADYHVYFNQSEYMPAEASDEFMVTWLPAPQQSQTTEVAGKPVDPVRGIDPKARQKVNEIIDDGLTDLFYDWLGDNFGERLLTQYDNGFLVTQLISDISEGINQWTTKILASKDFKDFIYDCREEYLESEGE